MRGRPVVALLALILLLTSACAGVKGNATTGHKAETLTPVSADLTEVGLTEEVARNIGVRTAPVESTGGQLRVATSAVIYRPDGTTWVYTEVRPFAYLRAAITIFDDTGATTRLIEGPPAGTPVVVQGATLLYGTEFKIGK